MTQAPHEKEAKASAPPEAGFPGGAEFTFEFLSLPRGIPPIAHHPPSSAVNNSRNRSALQIRETACRPRDAGQKRHAERQPG
jgi:hypothetical protein